ncbi:MAG: hypothetical protein Q7U54_17500 [Bacteroidales bacterium]|nr:hypothetical protein [Bacteroidales bacterium]
MNEIIFGVSIAILGYRHGTLPASLGKLWNCWWSFIGGFVFTLQLPSVPGILRPVMEVFSYLRLLGSTNLFFTFPILVSVRHYTFTPPPLLHHPLPIRHHLCLANIPHCITQGSELSNVNPMMNLSTGLNPLTLNSRNLLRFHISAR